MLDGAALAKKLLRDSPALPANGTGDAGEVGDPNARPLLVGERWAEDGEDDSGQGVETGHGEKTGGQVGSLHKWSHCLLPTGRPSRR